MKAKLLWLFWTFFMANCTAPGGEDELHKLAKARVKAAEASIQAFLSSERAGLRDYQMYYRLSRRLLDAQRDLDSTLQGELRAFQAHFDRMVELEQGIMRRIKEKAMGTEARYEGEYYRIEARFWLEKAKLKAKK
jgi:hypothetical protein